MHIEQLVKPQKELCEKSSNPIVFFTQKGKIVYGNSAIQKLGVKNKDIKGKNVWDFLGGKSRKLILDIIEGRKAGVEKFKYGADKPPYRISYAPLAYNEKEIIFLLQVILPDPDFDKMKSAFTKNPIVRAMNNRLDAAWFITDVVSGKNIFLSKSSETLMGWDLQMLEFGGWPFFYTLFQNDELKRLDEAIQKWLQLKNKHVQLYEHVSFFYSFSIRTKSGDYIYLDLETNLLERDEHGKALLMIGTLRPSPSSWKKSEFFRSSSYADAIKIIDGKTFVDIELLKVLKRKNNKTSTKVNLSKREADVLNHIGDGLSSEEIGEKLHLSKHTVNIYRKQLMKKLRVKNNAEMVRKAMQVGLIS